MIYIKTIWGRVSGYMEKEITTFITYLHNVKNTSTNTEMSYRRDLDKVRKFMESRGIHEVSNVSSQDLKDYVAYLEGNAS